MTEKEKCQTLKTYLPNPGTSHSQTANSQGKAGPFDWPPSKDVSDPIAQIRR